MQGARVSVLACRRGEQFWAQCPFCMLCVEVGTCGHEASVTTFGDMLYAEFVREAVPAPVRDRVISSVLSVCAVWVLLFSANLMTVNASESDERSVRSEQRLNEHDKRFEFIAGQNLGERMAKVEAAIEASNSLQLVIAGGIVMMLLERVYSHTRGKR